MNRMVMDAAMVVVGFGVALAVWKALKCQHTREMFDRFPDGKPALRCSRCLRMRPNILQSQPHYHRTQSGGPIPRPTGIDRVWAELDQPITDADLFDLVPSEIHLARHAASGASAGR